MYLALVRKPAKHGIEHRARFSISDAVYRHDTDPAIVCLALRYHPINLLLSAASQSGTSLDGGYPKSHP